MPWRTLNHQYLYFVNGLQYDEQKCIYTNSYFENINTDTARLAKKNYLRRIEWNNINAKQ